MGGSRTLGSGGKLWGPRGLQSGPRASWSGKGGGGRKASGVEENPGRGRHGVGGGVESSLNDSTHTHRTRGRKSARRITPR